MDPQRNYAVQGIWRYKGKIRSGSMIENLLLGSGDGVLALKHI
jgi:hypothetical protein